MLELKHLPYNRKLTERARGNRRNPTAAEKKIWFELLARRQLVDYKFTRQKPLGNFIVDFYCSELRLVVEIDGDSHAKQKEYDTERTDFLQGLGLKVIRYTNKDVLGNLEDVHSDLISKIK